MPAKDFRREFPLLLFAVAAATVADIETTVQAQRDPEAEEVNRWLYGERPSRLRMYATSIPVTLAFARLTRQLNSRYGGGHRHSWIWRMPLLALAAGHAAAAVLNGVNFPAPRRTV